MSRHDSYRNGCSGWGCVVEERARRATSDASVIDLQTGGGGIITAGLEEVDEIKQLIHHDGDTAASFHHCFYSNLESGFDHLSHQDEIVNFLPLPLPFLFFLRAYELSRVS